MSFYIMCSFIGKKYTERDGPLTDHPFSQSVDILAGLEDQRKSQVSRRSTVDRVNNWPELIAVRHRDTCRVELLCGRNVERIQ